MDADDSDGGERHWFEPVADHLGGAYLRYSFTKGTEQEVGFVVGALAVVNAVEFVPARIALAKLRFTFHDWSIVEFDLPSDHRAAEFAEDVTGLLGRVPSAA